MHFKQIHPIQVLNLFASEFIGEFPVILGDFSSRQFEIEFYDNEGHPLFSRKGIISDLPVNKILVDNVNPHTFNYNSQDAREMFDAQDKIIFDKIKELSGLTYYDDTFETKCDRDFSYRTYINLNPEHIGKVFSLT